jgi:nucleoid DNA-binding protein
MDHSDLIIELANRTVYTPRELRAILNELVTIIREQLGKGMDVRVTRLGCFTNMPAAARKGHIAGKGPVDIPATRRTKFKPCRDLIGIVKASHALFQDNLPEKFGLKEEKR